MLVGRKDLPARTMQELIAWLRANPDKATYPNSGGDPCRTYGAFIFKI